MDHEHKDASEELGKKSAAERQQLEAKKVKTAVYRVLYGDLLLALIVMTSAYLLVATQFKSVMVGALIFLIPNGIFAWFVFRKITRVNFMVINQAFYRAESMKFMTTAGLFAYSFKMLQPISAATIFATYGLLFVVHQVLAAFIVGRDT